MLYAILFIFTQSAQSASFDSKFDRCNEVIKQFVGQTVHLDSTGRLSIYHERGLASSDESKQSFSLKQANLNSEGCTHWTANYQDGVVNRLESHSNSSNCALEFIVDEQGCYVKKANTRYSLDQCLLQKKADDLNPLLKHCALLERQSPTGLGFKPGQVTYSADENKLRFLHTTKEELISKCSSPEAQVYFLNFAGPASQGCREFSDLTLDYVRAHPKALQDTAQNERSITKVIAK